MRRALYYKVDHTPIYYRGPWWAHLLVALMNRVVNRGLRWREALEDRFLRREPGAEEDHENNS